ncbi:unnamed protein product, partial [Timema podura]|nr:unnamed protein product [Timema podura]
LLAAKKLCPAYEEELIRMKNSPEMIDLDKINAELYAYLTNHTGRKISNVEDVEYLYNTLLIEEKYNFTLPEWTKSVYPDKMKPLAEIDFVVPTKTTLLKRLKSGPLLEEMVSNMKKKSENRLVPNRKMFVYSGHDTTVANLLNTLGVFDPQCPPYDALVLIELRKNSAGKYFVSGIDRKIADFEVAYPVGATLFIGQSKNIIDFKGWCPDTFKKSTKSVGVNETFLISKYRHLVYRQDQKGYVQAHSFIDGLLGDVFKLYKGHGNVALPTTPMYSGKVPINCKKMNDLRNVVHFVLDEHKEFYDNILLCPITPTQADKVQEDRD